MKRLLKIMTLAVVIGCSCKATKNHVIGYQIGAGLFYNFLGVINNIQYCKKNSLHPIVYWGKDSLYYEEAGYQGRKNAWEYYFEPLSDQTYTNGDAVWPTNCAPDGSKIVPIWEGHCEVYEKKEFRESAHTIIREYIKTRPYLTAKIESFFQLHMVGKKTIGIHLRGTDKKLEVSPINPDDLLNDANILAQNFPGCQFFVATDEDRLLKKAQSILNGKVISYEAYRSENGQPIHYGNNLRGARARLGEEVIIEAILLSRCDFFLHTCSSVSTAVLFLNPKLDHKSYKANPLQSKTLKKM